MALQYILDAGPIAQYPQILAHGGAGKLLVPQAVVDEIHARQARGLRADIQDILDRAIDSGAVVVPPLAGKVATLALECAEECGPGNVSVVTSDRRLIRLLASKGWHRSAAAGSCRSFRRQLRMPTWSRPPSGS